MNYIKIHSEVTNFQKNIAFSESYFSSVNISSILSVCKDYGVFEYTAVKSDFSVSWLPVYLDFDS